jgi:2-haloacid dehalogenase
VSRRVLLFDVNETLLDLAALDPHFEAAFGDKHARREWFATMLRSAFLLTITGPYRPFGDHFREALRQTAASHGVVVSATDAQRILGGVRRLPPHSDVRPALERLRAAGFRMAAFTNSTHEVEDEQLVNAGIRDLFETALSADDGKRLKPAREAYEHAAKLMGVPVSEVRLIAAHDWDVAGALRAGARAAFVARPGTIWNELVDRPDVWGVDLEDVAEQIIARDTP